MSLSTDQPVRHAVLVGSSVRALADSCLRAGIPRIDAIDQFGDADLRATHHSAPAIPGDAPALAAECLPATLLASGGVVNHPQLLRTLAKRHDWLGTHPDHIAAVRDVFQLQSFCKQFGFPFPQTERALPGDRAGWLAKSMIGAGGLHVRPATAVAPPETHGYFQRFVKGPLFSALAIGDSNGGRVLACMAQYAGLSDVAAPEYFWSGNLGPIRFTTGLQRDVELLVAALTREFSLVGVFGIDLIIRNNRPWLLEVNPRYTGSVEVLERAHNVSVLRDHISACLAERRRQQIHTTRSVEQAGPQATFRASEHTWESEIPQAALCHSDEWQGTELLRTDSTCLKWIVYAPDSTTIQTDLRDLEFGDVRLADIPRPGTFIARGHPVCSVLATASSISECERVAIQSVRRVHSSICADREK